MTRRLSTDDLAPCPEQCRVLLNSACAGPRQPPGQGGRRPPREIVERRRRGWRWSASLSVGVSPALPERALLAWPCNATTPRRKRSVAARSSRTTRDRRHGSSLARENRCHRQRRRAAPLCRAAPARLWLTPSAARCRKLPVLLRKQNRRGKGAPFLRLRMRRWGRRQKLPSIVRPMSKGLQA